MDPVAAVLKVEMVEVYHLDSVRALVAHRSGQAEVILKAHKKVRGATSTEKARLRVDSAEVVAALAVAALAVEVSAVAVSTGVEVPSPGPLQIAVIAVMAAPPCHRGHHHRKERGNRSQKRQKAAAKKIRKRQARAEEMEEVAEVL